MKAVLIHYHLGAGGVTRVLRSHVQALHGHVDEIAVLHGGNDDHWKGPDDVRVVPVDGLGYDPPTVSRTNLKVLAQTLRQTLQDLGFTRGETVLHVHNHGLGKNLSVPGALHELAEEGWAIVLHTHDFAEDFRPKNYQRQLAEMPSALDLPRQLYASAPHVHHALLNRRDWNVLAAAGVPAERIHLLPNPVEPPAANDAPGPAKQQAAAALGFNPEKCLLLYPVRGIRRKNVGEVLLWAALLGERCHAVVTLPPENPVEKPSFERWQRLAADLNLPLSFGLNGLPFGTALTACDRVLTTSVAEGFGLAFLEPWLLRRALTGRDLPEITADFRKEGLDLDGLQPRLDIPLDQVGAARYREAFDAAFAKAAGTYGSPPSSSGADAHIRHHAGLETVDFAALTPDLQAEVITETTKNPRLRTEILDANPALPGTVDKKAVDRERALLEANAEIVRERYSLASCRERLLRIYRAVGQERGDLTPPSRPSAVLESFLDPARFHPIRTA